METDLICLGKNWNVSGAIMLPKSLRFEKHDTTIVTTFSPKDDIKVGEILANPVYPFDETTDETCFHGTTPTDLMVSMMSTKPLAIGTLCVVRAKYFPSMYVLEVCHDVSLFFKKRDDLGICVTCSPSDLKSISDDARNVALLKVTGITNAYHDSPMFLSLFVMNQKRVSQLPLSMAITKGRLLYYGFMTDDGFFIKNRDVAELNLWKYNSTKIENDFWCNSLKDTRTYSPLPASVPQHTHICVVRDVYDGGFYIFKVSFRANGMHVMRELTTRAIVKKGDDVVGIKKVFDYVEPDSPFYLTVSIYDL